MPNPYTEQLDQLVPLFDQFNEISSQIQAEMAIALLQDPKMREDLSKKSNLSEEAMMKHLNKAIINFIAAMPLAQLNQSNLFLTAMAHHAEITGNPLFSDVIDRIQELNTERTINDY